MYYKRQKGYVVSKHKFRRKKNERFLGKTYLKNGILQFSDKRKIRGGAFPFATLSPIALKSS